MQFNSLRFGAVALASLACLSSTAVLAQVKTDGQWRGSGGAALSLTSGNTTSSSLLVNGEALRATAADKITLGANINHAKSKTGGVDRTTADKWAGFGQYDYNLSPQLFVFSKLGLEGDKLIHLDLRSALAAGLGYNLISTEQTSAELFGGLGYTTDKYGIAQTIGGKSGTSFSRASVYLGEASSHQLSATTSFKQRIELYPGISGDKAVLAKFSAGLSVAMSGALNLNVGLTDSYNSKPPVGAKTNDLGLFTGVSVKFGGL